MEKLDDRVVALAQRRVIDALETLDVEHNMAFIKEALRRAPNSLLLLILEDESGIRESSKSAIVQVTTRVKVVSKIDKAIVTTAAVLATIAKFAVEAVKSEVAESERESVSIASW